MCKIISNRIIIGNYLIESIKNDKYSFSFDEFEYFDRMLSPKLEELDYYSSFDDEGIIEFVCDYPSIIEYDSDSELYKLKDIEKNRFLRILNRYFRIGITKSITTAISEVSSLYWEEKA